MTLLDDIRKQSRSLRLTMFALSLITTISLAGVVWFSSFQSDLYALINTPEPDANSDQLAAGPEAKSPLVFMRDAFKSATASVFSIFDRSSSEPDRFTPERTPATTAKPLPVSDPR